MPGKVPQALAPAGQNAKVAKHKKAKKPSRVGGARVSKSDRAENFNTKTKAIKKAFDDFEKKLKVLNKKTKVLSYDGHTKIKKKTFTERKEKLLTSLAAIQTRLGLHSASKLELEYTGTLNLKLSGVYSQGSDGELPIEYLAEQVLGEDNAVNVDKLAKATRHLDQVEKNIIKAHKRLKKKEKSVKLLIAFSHIYSEVQTLYENNLLDKRQALLEDVSHYNSPEMLQIKESLEQIPAPKCFRFSKDGRRFKLAKIQKRRKKVSVGLKDLVSNRQSILESIEQFSYACKESVTFNIKQFAKSVNAEAKKMSDTLWQLEATYHDFNCYYQALIDMKEGEAGENSPLLLLKLENEFSKLLKESHESQNMRLESGATLLIPAQSAALLEDQLVDCDGSFAALLSKKETIMAVQGQYEKAIADIDDALKKAGRSIAAEQRADRVALYKGQMNTFLTELNNGFVTKRNDAIHRLRPYKDLEDVAALLQNHAVPLPKHEHWSLSVDERGSLLMSHLSDEQWHALGPSILTDLQTFSSSYKRHAAVLEKNAGDLIRTHDLELGRKRIKIRQKYERFKAYVTILEGKVQDIKSKAKGPIDEDSDEEVALHKKWDDALATLKEFVLPEEGEPNEFLAPLVAILDREQTTAALFEADSNLETKLNALIEGYDEILKDVKLKTDEANDAIIFYDEEALKINKELYQIIRHEKATQLQRILRKFLQGKKKEKLLSVANDYKTAWNSLKEKYEELKGCRHENEEFRTLKQDLEKRHPKLNFQATDDDAEGGSQSDMSAMMASILAESKAALMTPRTPQHFDTNRRLTLPTPHFTPRRDNTETKQGTPLRYPASLRDSVLLMRSMRTPGGELASLGEQSSLQISDFELEDLSGFDAIVPAKRENPYLEQLFNCINEDPDYDLSDDNNVKLRIGLIANFKEDFERLKANISQIEASKNDVEALLEEHRKSLDKKELLKHRLGIASSNLKRNFDDLVSKMKELKDCDGAPFSGQIEDVQEYLESLINEPFSPSPIKLAVSAIMKPTSALLGTPGFEDQETVDEYRTLTNRLNESIAAQRRRLTIGKQKAQNSLLKRLAQRKLQQSLQQAGGASTPVATPVKQTAANVDTQINPMKAMLLAIQHGQSTDRAIEQIVANNDNTEIETFINEVNDQRQTFETKTFELSDAFDFYISQQQNLVERYYEQLQARETSIDEHIKKADVVLAVLAQMNIDNTDELVGKIKQLREHLFSQQARLEQFKEDERKGKHIGQTVSLLKKLVKSFDQDNENIDKTIERINRVPRVILRLQKKAYRKKLYQLDTLNEDIQNRKRLLRADALALPNLVLADKVAEIIDQLGPKQALEQSSPDLPEDAFFEDLERFKKEMLELDELIASKEEESLILDTQRLSLPGLKQAIIDTIKSKKEQLDVVVARIREQFPKLKEKRDKVLALMAKAKMVIPAGQSTLDERPIAIEMTIAGETLTFNTSGITSGDTLLESSLIGLSDIERLASLLSDEDGVGDILQSFIYDYNLETLRLLESVYTDEEETEDEDLVSQLRGDTAVVDFIQEIKDRFTAFYEESQALTGCSLSANEAFYYYASKQVLNFSAPADLNKVLNTLKNGFNHLSLSKELNMYRVFSAVNIAESIETDVQRVDKLLYRVDMAYRLPFMLQEYVPTPPQVTEPLQLLSLDPFVTEAQSPTQIKREMSGQSYRFKDIRYKIVQLMNYENGLSEDMKTLQHDSIFSLYRYLVSLALQVTHDGNLEHRQAELSQAGADTARIHREENINELLKLPAVRSLNYPSLWRMVVIKKGLEAPVEDRVEISNVYAAIQEVKQFINDFEVEFNTDLELLDLDSMAAEKEKELQSKPRGKKIGPSEALPDKYSLQFSAYNDCLLAFTKQRKDELLEEIGVYMAKVTSGDIEADAVELQYYLKNQAELFATLVSHLHPSNRGTLLEDFNKALQGHFSQLDLSDVTIRPALRRAAVMHFLLSTGLQPKSSRLKEFRELADCHKHLDSLKQIQDDATHEKVKTANERWLWRFLKQSYRAEGGAPFNRRPVKQGQDNLLKDWNFKRELSIAKKHLLAEYTLEKRDVETVKFKSSKYSFTDNILDAEAANVLADIEEKKARLKASFESAFPAGAYPHINLKNLLENLSNLIQSSSEASWRDMRDILIEQLGDKDILRNMIAYYVYPYIALNIQAQNIENDPEKGAWDYYKEFALPEELKNFAQNKRNKVDLDLMVKVLKRLVSKGQVYSTKQMKVLRAMRQAIEKNTSVTVSLSAGEGKSYLSSEITDIVDCEKCIFSVSPFRDGHEIADPVEQNMSNLNALLKAVFFAPDSFPKLKFDTASFKRFLYYIHKFDDINKLIEKVTGLAGADPLIDTLRQIQERQPDNAEAKAQLLGYLKRQVTTFKDEYDCANYEAEGETPPASYNIQDELDRLDMHSIVNMSATSNDVINAFNLDFALSRFRLFRRRLSTVYDEDDSPHDLVNYASSSKLIEHYVTDIGDGEKIVNEAKLREDIKISINQAIAQGDIEHQMLYAKTRYAKDKDILWRKVESYTKKIIDCMNKEVNNKRNKEIVKRFLMKESSTVEKIEGEDLDSVFVNKAAEASVTNYCEGKAQDPNFRGNYLLLLPHLDGFYETKKEIMKDIVQQVKSQVGEPAKFSQCAFLLQNYDQRMKVVIDLSEDNVEFKPVPFEGELEIDGPIFALYTDSSTGGDYFLNTKRNVKQLHLMYNKRFPNLNQFFQNLMRNRVDYPDTSYHIALDESLYDTLEAPSDKDAFIHKLIEETDDFLERGYNRHVKLKLISKLMKEFDEQFDVELAKKSKVTNEIQKRNNGLTFCDDPKILNHALPNSRRLTTMVLNYLVRHDKALFLEICNHAFEQNIGIPDRDKAVEVIVKQLNEGTWGFDLNTYKAMPKGNVGLRRAVLKKHKLQNRLFTSQGSPQALVQEKPVKKVKHQRSRSASGTPLKAGGSKREASLSRTPQSELQYGFGESRSEQDRIKKRLFEGCKAAVNFMTDLETIDARMEDFRSELSRTVLESSELDGVSETVKTLYSRMVTAEFEQKEEFVTAILRLYNNSQRTFRNRRYSHSTMFVRNEETGEETKVTRMKPTYYFPKLNAKAIIDSFKQQEKDSNAYRAYQGKLRETINTLDKCKGDNMELQAHIQAEQFRQKQQAEEAARAAAEEAETSVDTLDISAITDGYERRRSSAVHLLRQSQQIGSRRNTLEFLGVSDVVAEPTEEDGDDASRRSSRRLSRRLSRLDASGDLSDFISRVGHEVVEVGDEEGGAKASRPELPDAAYEYHQDFQAYLEETEDQEETTVMHEDANHRRRAQKFNLRRRTMRALPSGKGFGN